MGTLQLLRSNADVFSMGAPNILIFHHPSSRSVRIVWLCDELGLDYDLDVITVHYRKGNLSRALRAI